MNILPSATIQKMRILKESGVDNEGIAETLELSIDDVVTALPIIFGNIDTLVELKATAGKLGHMISEMSSILDKANTDNASYKDLSLLMKQEQELVSKRAELLNTISKMEFEQYQAHKQQTMSNYENLTPISTPPILPKKPIKHIMKPEDIVVTYDILRILSIHGFSRHNIKQITLKEKKIFANSINCPPKRFNMHLKLIEKGKIPKLQKTKKTTETDIITAMRMRKIWTKKKGAV